MVLTQLYSFFSENTHLCHHFCFNMVDIEWRIEVFPKVGVLTYFLAQNCMKMKEFGPPRAGARPWRPLRSATNIYFSVTKSGSVHLDE